MLIVDSIQTVWLPESESYAGSVTQVRDCTQALMEFSKRTGCATFIVGHVTKDGAIAGPRLLEHLVDTVLYFEGEASGEYRIVRAYKNRFGSIDEICVFAMHDDGLHEVAQSVGDLSCAGAATRPSGSCVVASIVGSRPVLVEVQALVGETQLRHAAPAREQRRSSAPGDDHRGAGTARRDCISARTTSTPRSPADCASANPPPISASRSRSHRRFATARLRAMRLPSANSVFPAKCAR